MPPINNGPPAVKAAPAAAAAFRNSARRELLGLCGGASASTKRGVAAEQAASNRAVADLILLPPRAKVPIPRYVQEGMVCDGRTTNGSAMRMDEHLTRDSRGTLVARRAEMNRI
jgi:hypothetical protein